MLKRIISLVCALALLTSAFTVSLTTRADTASEILTAGECEQLNADSIDSTTGFAKVKGKYYELGGSLKATAFTSVYSSKTATLTVDGKEFTHGFSFASYSGENINSDAAADASNTYIQYRVTGDTLVKVPVISVDLAGTPGNFDLDGFKIEVSQDGKSFTSTEISSEVSKLELSAIQYYLKNYSVAIPTNAKYLRVTLPKSEKVKGIWNQTGWLAQGFMVLPSYCEAEAQKTLTAGTHETVNADNIDSATGYAYLRGDYYKLSNKLKVTAFTSIFNSKTDTLTLDGIDFTHGFSFASYSNGTANINSDAANIYIQYKVTPGTTVKVPVISVDNAGKPSNFDLDGFKIEVSQDGKIFSEASAVGEEGSIPLSGVVYYLKNYSVAIPTNAKYLRVTLPKSEKVKGIWNQTGWLAQGFFVLAAYCTDGNGSSGTTAEQKTLTPGDSEAVDSEDMSSLLGFANAQGEYYKLGGKLKVTALKSLYNSKTDTLTVDGVDFTHGLSFANYSNGKNTNGDAAEGAENCYVEYKVTGGTTVKLPMLSVDLAGTPGNFDLEGFKIQVSEDGKSFSDATVETTLQKVDICAIRYYVKKYIVTVPTNINYLRVTLPKSDKVTGTWSQTERLSEGFMLLGAYCPGDTAVLTPGTDDTIDSGDVTSSGYAEKYGLYHELGGDFAVTAFSSFYGAKGKCFVDGNKYRYAFTFESYSNGGANTNADVKSGASNYYIQYRVQEGTTVKVPLISVDKDEKPANFDGFKLMSSKDGKTYTAVSPSYTLSKIDISSADYWLKNYSFTVPSGVKYLKIVWPKSSEVNALWDQTSYLAQSVAMLPAYCVGDTDVLVKGVYDTVSDAEILNTGYADPNGQYHKLNGNFKITAISDIKGNSGRDSYVMTDDTAHYYGYSFASYKKGSANVNKDTENYYIEYHVQPGRETVIPIISTTSKADGNFSGFKFLVSVDGKTYTEIKPEYEDSKPNISSEGYTLRKFAVSVPENANYLRIVWPKSESVGCAGNDTATLATSLVMLPAYCPPDPDVLIETKLLTPGDCESISESDIGSDGFAANGDDKYYYVKGELKVTSVNNIWNWNSDKIVVDGHTFTHGLAFKSYVDGTDNVNKDSQVGEANYYTQYHVMPDTIVKLPLVSINESNYGKFKFRVSEDGVTFRNLDSSCIEYSQKSLNISGLTYTQRTYSLTVSEDINYLRIVWPNSEDVTPLWNTDQLQRSLIMLPAYCEVIPKYAPSVTAREEQYTVDMYTDGTVAVLQEKSKPLTVGDVKNNLTVRNAYIIFTDSNGNELSDKDYITKAVAMVAYSKGSKYHNDGELFGKWTVSVNTVNKIVAPVISSTDDRIIIDHKNKTITAAYYSDETLSYQNLIESLEIENAEVDLVDSNGSLYRRTYNLINNENGVSLQVFATSCPDIRVGLLTATYKVYGVVSEKEYIFESLDKSKVAINSEYHTITVKSGMTIKEFLKNVRAQWCDLIFYEITTDEQPDLVEIFDTKAEIIDGMSLDLIVGNTTVYYELCVDSSGGSLLSGNGDGILPETGDVSMAVTAAILFAAAAVVFMYSGRCARARNEK